MSMSSLMLRDSSYSNVVTARDFDGDDLDYDYDVFLFWPSSQQFALLIDEAQDNDLETHSVSGSEYTGSSLESVSDLSLPSTPTYTVKSDFAFPSYEDEMSSVGYSQLFRAGFSYASKSFVRRVDRILSRLWQNIHPSKN
ncbi:hypothetical protein OBBRIDRAFT_787841 [Obba rivulosa]|uniref:Uncharacterized protein n=1 Tax=Obba rivulosa TaxID=1052685 RepID=A0A8E2J6V6_9APHY|nr:hypothetical protein OBBRIDRAFT_787841 [Obba rivulosa]